MSGGTSGGNKPAIILKVIEVRSENTGKAGKPQPVPLFPAPHQSKPVTLGLQLIEIAGKAVCRYWWPVGVKGFYILYRRWRKYRKPFEIFSTKNK